ncbi:MAG: poly-gamma-glutamate system protein [candidate division WOR-3 bacterium]|nr:poly-gamma-glutamate system protein [candidate division WOR-3 bacterium]
MKKRTGKVGKTVLIAFALFSIFLFVILSASIRVVKAKFYEEKLKAGQIYLSAMEVIKKERLRLGLPIDTINDPNKTGLIGSQYTTITLERNDLSSVLTTTDPNFPAIFIELFKKLKLKENDTIAVGLDGSLVGANLALYSAMRVLGLKPIIITTVSSAMWGANEPQFTFLDMERICYQERIFPFRSSFATLGGEDDLGRGFSPQGRAELMLSCHRNQIKLLSSQNLQTSLGVSPIERRLQVYFTGTETQESATVSSARRRIKAFINIGKSVANIGANLGVSPRSTLNQGIIKNKNKKIDPNSVIYHMLIRKIPVINLTDANKIAMQYGLPIAAVPLPTLGKGKLFAEKRYSETLALIFTLLIIIILYFVIRYDLEYYLTKKKEH